MKLRLLIIAALCAVFATLTTEAALAGGGARYYVALGDSLARSAQPNGDYQHGYAEQLLALLQPRDPSLRLVKLACGGATTTDMVYGSDDRSCAFPHKTQLAEAVAFLNAHRRFVVLVTIDIGGNDLPDRAAIATNLPIILDELRTAAGPRVPIVGMNYYDPCLVGVWFGFDVNHPSCAPRAPTLAAEVQRATADNDFLEGFYQADPAHGAAPYADVERAFEVTDTTPDVDVNGDGVLEPRDVVRECQWTWMCFPPPLAPDIHASTAGYGVIAQAFLDALT